MAESMSSLSSMGLAGLLAVLGLLALGLWYTSPIWRLVLVIGCRRFSAKWVWGIGLVVSLAAAGVSIHAHGSDIPGYTPNGSIAEAAYRTLSLLAFSADWTMASTQAPLEGDGPRDLPTAIDFFRFWIPAWVVGLGGSLLLFRQLGHGLQRRLMPRRGHTVVLGLGEAGLAYVTCWSDQAAPAPAPRRPAAGDEPARRRWRRWLACEPPPEPWWPHGLRGAANRGLGRFLCRLPLCRRLGPFLCHGPIVVVERDPDNPAVRSCRRLGIPVLIGDALDTAGDVLRDAGVQHAATVVGLLPDDVANVELALRVQQFRADHGRAALGRRPADVPGPADDRAPLILISQVNDLHLVRRLNHYEKITKMSPTDVRFQNIYRLMADQLLLRHPPDFYAELFGAAAPHIVIYGFGQLGQQVFAETLRLGHALDQGVPRVTIVDRDGARVRQLVQAEYPGIFDAGTPDVVVLRIAGVALPGPVVPEDLLARLDEPLPTQHVVCFDDECFALSFALALRDALLAGVRRNAPIFVRTRRKHGLAALLDSNTGRPEIPDGIFPFGTLERILRPEILNDRGLETLSEAIHEVTYKLAGEVGKEDPAPPDAADDAAATAVAPAAGAGRAAATAWESLDDLFRRSNRLAALHLDAKLRGLDLRRVPVTDGERSVPEVWTRRLGDLARLEHRRWLGAQVADGWRYGPRMDTLRRHTAMEDFDRLGPRDQDNDYLATALLPGIVGADAAHCKQAIRAVRHRDDETPRRTPDDPYPGLTRPLADKLAKVRRHPQRLCPVARIGILAPPPCAADADPDRHGAIEAQLRRFRAHFEANDRERLKALARESALTIVSPLLHPFERAAASWLYRELVREAPAPAPTPIALSSPARHEILALLPVPYDFLSGVQAIWGPIGDDGERAAERAFQELAGHPHVRYVEMPLGVPGHALSAREGLHGRRYLAQFRETWRYMQRRCTELHLLSVATAAAPTGDNAGLSPNPAAHLSPVEAGDGARPALKVYTATV